MDAKKSANNQPHRKGIGGGVAMTTKIFQGLLAHKNPTCEICGVTCFSVYNGGTKDRIKDLFFCRKCKIMYQLPEKKICEFTEAKK